MLGKKLKEIRKRHDLTQEQLADIMGLSRSTITKYERNERYPEIDVLVKIADHFSISLDYLLGRKVTQAEYIATAIATELNKQGLLNSTDTDIMTESILNVTKVLIKEFVKYDHK